VSIPGGRPNPLLRSSEYSFKDIHVTEADGSMAFPYPYVRVAAGPVRLSIVRGTR